MDRRFLRFFVEQVFQRPCRCCGYGGLWRRFRWCCRQRFDIAVAGELGEGDLEVAGAREFDAQAFCEGFFTHRGQQAF